MVGAITCFSLPNSLHVSLYTKVQRDLRQIRSTDAPHKPFAHINQIPRLKPHVRDCYLSASISQHMSHIDAQNKEYIPFVQQTKSWWLGWEGE